MKSKCIETNLFAKYVEGCFSDREREQVEAHLSVCSRCRQVLVNAHYSMDEIKLSELEPASENEIQAVMEHFGFSKKLEKIYKWMQGSLSLETHLFPGLLTMPGLTRKSSESAAEYAYILFEKKMGDLDIHLYAEKTQYHTFNIWISVSKQSIKAHNVRLVLIQEQGGIISRPLVGQYEHLKNMSFGSYNFIIKQNAEEKGRCHINFKNEEVIVKDDYS